MIKQDVITIDKSLVPCKFNIVLGGESFSLQVNYNAAAGLFVVDLYKNGNLLCAGEPIIYGVPLWTDVYKASGFPVVNIVPIDQSGEMASATYDNLGDTVILMIDNGEVSLDG